ncbi:hypothetical protein NHX12_013476 [Muraenolepis orangiensis]|uniref:LRRNT domain-containing protein n=1 Tax=Muraenolepis orangiensis TaxID=630683 RepID=A0A9Q0DG96_9TELE|nr:hypothetical protein NHX12_013476 [Muraenolepis orangiensis]
MFPALLLLLLLLLGRAGGTRALRADRDRPLQGPQQAAGPPSCPGPCQCEGDGIFVMVDCSELGLSSVPENLSPLTTYL